MDDNVRRAMLELFEKQGKLQCRAVNLYDDCYRPLSARRQRLLRALMVIASGIAWMVRRLTDEMIWLGFHEQYSERYKYKDYGAVPPDVFLKFIKDADANTR
jgi:hypothetical protein